MLQKGNKILVYTSTGQFYFGIFESVNEDKITLCSAYHILPSNNKTSVYSLLNKKHSVFISLCLDSIEVTGSIIALSNAIYEWLRKSSFYNNKEILLYKDACLIEINGTKIVNINGKVCILQINHSWCGKIKLFFSNFESENKFFIKDESIITIGETLRDAYEKYRNRLYSEAGLKNATTDVTSFIVHQYPDVDVRMPVFKFFCLHYQLSDSCIIGRREFLARHKLKMDDVISMRDFLYLTKDEPDNSQIKLLMAKYKLI